MWGKAGAVHRWSGGGVGLYTMIGEKKFWKPFYGAALGNLILLFVFDFVITC